MPQGTVVISDGDAGCPDEASDILVARLRGIFRISNGVEPCTTENVTSVGLRCIVVGMLGEVMA